MLRLTYPHSHQPKAKHTKIELALPSTTIISRKQIKSMTNMTNNSKSCNNPRICLLQRDRADKQMQIEEKQMQKECLNYNAIRLVTTKRIMTHLPYSIQMNCSSMNSTTRTINSPFCSSRIISMTHNDPFYNKSKQKWKLHNGSAQL